MLAGEKSGEIGRADHHAALDELHYLFPGPANWLVYERYEMEGPGCRVTQFSSSGPRQVN